MIVEILSSSTEEYDRGEKFEHYKRIPSLREYVLVAHDRRAIDVFTRTETGGWAHAASGSGGSARIPSLDFALEVDAVYDAAEEPLPS